MIIQPVLTPRVIEDYDILFQNGILLPLSIDRDAGDTVDFTPGQLVATFHLAGKPTLADPSTKLPDEDITVFVSHVISVTKRYREVMPLTPEQEADFQSLHKIPNRLQ